MFEPDSVEVVTVDSFGTLVDPASAASALVDVVEDPGAVAREWHPLAVNFAIAANAVDTYEPYFDLHVAALEYLLAERGVSASGEELEELTGAYRELAPFDDVRSGMEALADAGYEVAILSNGEPSLLESMLSESGLGSVVDATISADEIEVFKPSIEVYEHAADRLDTDLEGIAHVTAGWTDVMGAANAGMQGVWIDRRGSPWPSFGHEPHLQIGTLYELVEALPGEPA